MLRPRRVRPDGSTFRHRQPLRAEEGTAMMILICICNILFLFLCSLALSVRFNDTMIQTVPISMCLIGFVLYILAFFQKMFLINLIAPAGILFLALMARRSAVHTGRRRLLRRIRRSLYDIQFWMNVLAALLLMFLVRHRMILEWDAYNFWGADVKSLFYRNGFADAFSNVAPSFGDYPPMVQLILWWFLNLSGKYEEGMLFSGYFAFSASILFVVTDVQRKRGILRMTAFSAGTVLLLIMLPGMLDTAWYRSLYMDPILGFLFGSILITIIRRHRCTDGFYHFKIAVLLSALTLTKSIGILWAVLASLFFLLWKKSDRVIRLTAVKYAGLSTAVCLTWVGYCRRMHRTTDLTESITGQGSERISELTHGTFFSSGHNLDYIQAYGKAFLFEPVHRRTWDLLSLTPFFCIVVLVAALIFFRWIRVLSRRQFRKVIIFFLLVNLLIYSMLLWAHLTIFSGETQYLKPENMLTQMTRYSFPLNIAEMMMLFALAWAPMSGRRTKPVYVERRSLVARTMLTVLILIFAGYGTMANCFIPGHDPLDADRLQQRYRTEHQYAALIHQSQSLPVKGTHQRILVVSMEEFVSPIVSFNVSPISMQDISYYGNITKKRVLDDMKACGASCLYVQSCTTEQEAVFRSMTKNFRKKEVIRIDGLW